MSWEEMGANITYNVEGMTANTRQHKLVAH